MKTIAAILALAVVSATAGAQSIKVRIEDKPVVFDSAPRMVRGVTMVPVRNLVDSMNATLKWSLERQTVTVWRSNRRFDMVLNSRQALINGKTVNMEEAAFLERGRTYVPLKFVAEAAGYIVSHEDGVFVLRLTNPLPK